jgi:uncharacterized protein HemX
MDHDTLGVILQAVMKQWGIVALFLLALAAMAGVSVAQMVQMRNWKPQTREIAVLLRDSVQQLKVIAAKLDAQHATCTRHYDFAQKQIEGMASIGHEMRSVVDAIAASDKFRTAEIMQLMTVIASRHLP